MISTGIDHDLESIRREISRLQGEADRLRSALAMRPRAERHGSPQTLAGLAARDLLAAIDEAMTALRLGDFFSEYSLTAADLRKLVALCEDDAARAGPLVDVEARWFGNTIRKRLI